MRLRCIPMILCFLSSPGVFALTNTPTPNCCQVAQTITGQSASVTLTGTREALNPAKTLLYVGDSVNNQLQEFQISSGSMVPAGVLSGFNGPEGVATDTSGNLYVAEYGASDVKEVTSANVIVTTIPLAGQAMAVFVDTNGDVYAASTGSPGIVQVFQAGHFGSAAATLNGGGSSPDGMVKSVNGGTTCVYVSDNGNNNIYKFTQGTGYNFTSNGALTGLPSIIGPADMTTDASGNIYVTSYITGQFFVFDPAFDPISLHSCQPGINPLGIAVDPSGNVYLGGTGASGSFSLVMKVGYCNSPPVLTPTPSYGGLNPPTSGQCFIYPSPAKGSQATVSYDMAEAGTMELKVWNERAELVDDVTDRRTEGVQITPFSINGFASGVYFYSVTLSYDSGRTDKIAPRKFVILH